jgi:CCR4-NOT transcription complex subunit 1
MTLPDALMSGAMRACAPGQGELSKPPTVLSSLTAPLTSHPRYPNLKSDLDAFLRGAGGRDGSQSNARDAFLKELPNALMQSDAALVRASGSRYNAPLINALVLYVAAATITAQADGAHGGGACLQLLLSLCRLLDEEGRYLLLNAMANQLRYPNSHTYFVSGMMLQLFAADQVHPPFPPCVPVSFLFRLFSRRCCHAHAPDHKPSCGAPI